MKNIATFLFAITLVAGCADTASGQQVMRRVEEPRPLDATDPSAVRSGALVKHLLAGEKEPAVALMRKEADEKYAQGGTLESDVDAAIKRLSSGKYTIDRYEVGFGSDVVVFLTNDKGDDANIVVRFNNAKKMTGFAEAKIQR